MIPAKPQPAALDELVKSFLLFLSRFRARASKPCCVYRYCAYTHNGGWTPLWTHKWLRFSFPKKSLPQVPDPAVCIRTVPIRTAVFEPCCDYTNSFQKVRKRSHHSGGQTLLCVYAPCLYAQRCLSLVVITQVLPKKFAKEAATAGSKPFSVYTHRAYTHGGVWPLLRLHKFFRKGPQKNPSQWCPRCVYTHRAYTHSGSISTKKKQFC